MPDGVVSPGLGLGAGNQPPTNSRTQRHGGRAGFIRIVEEQAIDGRAIVQTGIAVGLEDTLAEPCSAARREIVLERAVGDDSLGLEIPPSDQTLRRGKIRKERAPVNGVSQVFRRDATACNLGTRRIRRTIVAREGAAVNVVRPVDRTARGLVRTVETRAAVDVGVADMPTLVA